MEPPRPAFTLGQLLASAQREAALRAEVYPRWIARGKIRRSEADYELAAMRAIAVLLSDLRDDRASQRRPPASRHA